MVSAIIGNRDKRCILLLTQYHLARAFRHQYVKNLLDSASQSHSITIGWFHKDSSDKRTFKLSMKIRKTLIFATAVFMG